MTEPINGQGGFEGIEQHRRSEPSLSSLAIDNSQSTTSGYPPSTNPYATHSSTRGNPLPASFYQETLVDSTPPSTFLTSYYPESRFITSLPSQTTGSSYNPSPTQSYITPPAAGTDLSSSHNTWDRTTSQPPRHLLDGVALNSPIPFAPHNPTPPTYDFHLPPGLGVGILPTPDKPWVPKPTVPWQEVPIYDSSAGLYDKNTVNSNRGPSVSPIDQNSGSQGRDSPSSTYGTAPNLSTATSASNSRSHSDQSPPLPMLPSNGHLQVRSDVPHAGSFPLYNIADASNGVGFQAISSDSSHVSGEDYAQALAIYSQILAGLPHIQPPQSSSAPSINTHSNLNQSYSTLVNLAVTGRSIITGQNRISSSTSLTSALPATSPSLTHPPDMGIHHRLSTSSSASSGTGVKRSSPSGRPASPSDPNPKRQTTAAKTGKKGVITKCLGCGATETPEWRRGPMGPRTLCNACGLVHRKWKKKQAENGVQNRIPPKPTGNLSSTNGTGQTLDERFHMKPPSGG